jgi:hypothetical protein
MECLPLVVLDMVEPQPTNMEKSTYSYGQPIKDWRDTATKLQHLKQKSKDPSLKERVQAIETQIKKPK